MTGAFDSADGLQHRRLRRVRHVHHHAEAVHLGDHLPAERAERRRSAHSPVASPVFESESWLCPLCASDM